MKKNTSKSIKNSIKNTNTNKKEYKDSLNSFNATLKTFSIMDSNRKERIEGYKS